MSPEQARGLRSLDARTDLYSLGLVAYTMLTGNLAFTAESVGDLLLQICVQPLPKLRNAAPWLPPAMEDWFQKACAREPEQRYPSATALVDALRLAAGISSPAASPEVAPFVGANTPLPEPAAERPGQAVSPLASHGGPRSTTAGTARGATPDPGRRTRRLVLASSAVGLLAGVVGVALALRFARAPDARVPTTSSPPAATPAPALSIAPPATLPLEPIPPSLQNAIAAPLEDAGAPSLEKLRPSGRPHPPLATPSPATVAKPPSAPLTRPPGTIDLGY